MYFWLWSVIDFSYSQCIFESNITILPNFLIVLLRRNEFDSYAAAFAEPTVLFFLGFTVVADDSLEEHHPVLGGPLGFDDPVLPLLLLPDLDGHVDLLEGEVLHPLLLKYDGPLGHCLLEHAPEDFLPDVNTEFLELSL